MKRSIFTVILFVVLIVGFGTVSLQAKTASTSKTITVNYTINMLTNLAGNTKTTVSVNGKTHYTVRVGDIMRFKSNVGYNGEALVNIYEHVGSGKITSLKSIRFLFGTRGQQLIEGDGIVFNHSGDYEFVIAGNSNLPKKPNSSTGIVYVDVLK